VMDADAPFSPSSVLRLVFTPDMPRDTEPSVHWIGMSTAREVYTGWWIKLSSNWTGSPAGACKMTFLWTSPGGQGQVYSALFGSSPPHHSVIVHNDGLRPIRVLGVGRSGPGFRLDRVDGPLPSTVEPGEYLELVLIYAVTDCAAVPTGPWPVPVVVERPWGVQTVYVQPPLLPATTHEGTSHWPDLEWQHWLADTACRYPT